MHLSDPAAELTTAGRGCLYTLVFAGREHHEDVLRELVAPVVDAVRGSRELHSLFFARYDTPAWQIRFRVLGEPAWIEGSVRRRVERQLEHLRGAVPVDDVQLARYDRELARYGGEVGMELAERLFLHDTLACLELIAAEAAGRSGRSRRELALLLTERLLDLLALEPRQRRDFYRLGYGWTEELGTWGEAERAAVEARYRQLRPALTEMFFGSLAADEEALWGGAVPAAIVRRFVAGAAPVVRELLAAHRAGSIDQDLVSLAWSYTHMSCNRLGIGPVAEAILRYVMHRFTEEVGSPVAPREAGGAQAGLAR